MNTAVVSKNRLSMNDPSVQKRKRQPPTPFPPADPPNVYFPHYKDTDINDSLIGDEYSGTSYLTPYDPHPMTEVPDGSDIDVNADVQRSLDVQWAEHRVR